MRRRILLFGAVVALLAMALPGAAFAGQRGAGTCSDGTMYGGTYRGFTVTGTCTIEAGATVQINGNLTIAAGASLDDHGAEGWKSAQVHVTGNVKVGKGAVLGLGYNAAEGTLGPDTVGGNIVANQPLALQLGNVTVGGNVISIGGGVLSMSAEDFRNFPVKDNVIHGNLVVMGWQGGWIGLIRNHVDGNVIFAYNVSRSNPETGPGTDVDSSEVMGTDLSAFGGPVVPQTIGGNLICHGNVPAAQINPADGGAKSVVGGKGIGECAGLTQ
jgi:type 1 fimbria pilin